MALHTDMLQPALIVFFGFMAVGLIIMKVSGHKAAQRQRDTYSLMANPPEQYWVDNQPSAGATFLYWLLSAIGAYIAASMLVGYLLGF
jgi:hypothetical protein